MNSTKRIKDGAISLAVFIVLLFIWMFAPVLSTFLIFLLPVPFIVYTYKHDWKNGFVMFLASSILAAFILSVFSLPVTLVAGIGGILIGHGMHKRYSAYETLARGVLGFIVGILGLYVITQLLLGVNWTESIREMLAESIEISASMFEQFGMGAETEQMMELMELQADYVIQLVPALLLILAAVLAFLSQWIGYKAVNRIDRKNFHFPPFRTLQFPVSIIWIYLAVLLFSFFINEQENFLYQPIQNLLILIGMLLVVQGLSFIFYYAHHKNMSKAIPVLSIVLVFLMPWLFLTFVRILGIIDIGFRLRDYVEKRK